MNVDEMNGVRADAFELWLGKLRASLPNVLIRPYIGVILQHGTDIKNVMIEDAEIRVNLTELDQYLQKQTDDAGDLLHLPRRKG